MMIFSGLLGVPLLLINIIAFKALEERVGSEQRANGEAALISAERIIADYLPTLEPGFSIDATLDDDLLGWLSRVTGHEVNLYWQGFVRASSRPELFAAGVLPRRIPGAALARLAAGSEVVAERRHEVGSELSYLELYRRVALPGEQPSVTGLFLSVPLVAQQEEATRELRALFERSLSATVLLFLVLMAVGSRLAAAFTEPVMAIVERTDRIARGATSLGLRPEEPELATLVAAIDAMAERIAAGRDNLLREKQVVDGVVANITSAVVSFGHDRRVQMCNRVAAELLGAELGESYAELAARSSPPLRQLLESWPAELVRATMRRPRQAALVEGRSGETGEQEWTVAWVPVAGEGDPAALLVVEDVTEVLRGQRLEAWAEMARMIAHEIKNPLTPIRLSAEHLKRVHDEAPERVEEIFDRCLDNILDQVDELKETAAAFSTYSRIPAAQFEPLDLAETLRVIVDGYRTDAAGRVGTAENGVPGVPGVQGRTDLDADELAITLVFDVSSLARTARGELGDAGGASDRLSDGSASRSDRSAWPSDGSAWPSDRSAWIVRHDRKLISRVVRNLLENAIQASGGRGAIEVRAERANDEVRVTVTDRGPGVPEGALSRIFEPSFSTTSGGTGLGLAICRRIVDEHGGRIEARNHDLGGLAVSFSLPVEPRVLA
jgi:two-component system nitrogen regulation sensor histidine kinase NtrY